MSIEGRSAPDTPKPQPPKVENVANAPNATVAMRRIVEGVQVSKARSAQDIAKMQGQITRDFQGMSQDDKNFAEAIYLYSGVVENTSARRAINVDARGMQILQGLEQQFVQDNGKQPDTVERNVLYNQAQQQASQEAMNIAAMNGGPDGQQWVDAMKQRNEYFKLMEMFNAGLSPNATPEERERYATIREYMSMAARDIRKLEQNNGGALKPEQKIEIIAKYQTQALQEVENQHTQSILLPEDPKASPAQQARAKDFNAATEKVFGATPEGKAMRRRTLALANDISTEPDPKKREQMRQELSTLLREEYKTRGIDLTQAEVDRLIAKNTDLDLERFINRVDSTNGVVAGGTPEEKARFYKAMLEGDTGTVNDITAAVAKRTGDSNLDRIAKRGQKIDAVVRERNQQRTAAALSTLGAPALYSNLPQEQQVAVGRSLEQGADPAFIGVMLENAQPVAGGLQSNIEGMTVTLDSSGRAVLEGTRNMDEASARGFEESMVVLLAQRTGAGEAFRSERSETRALIKALTRINVRDQNIDGADRYAKLEETMTELFSRSQGDAFAVLEKMKIIDGGVPNISLARAWGAQLRVLGESRTLPLATYERIAEEWQRTGEPYELFTPVTVALLEQTPIEEESSPDSQSALA